VTHDSDRFKNTPKWLITGIYCFVSFLLSLMYCTDAGLNFLDVVDYYINFVMTLVGFLEVFGAGWVYGIDKQIENVGVKAGECMCE
jgi:SNF family Na+-dependent transporter